MSLYRHTGGLYIREGLERLGQGVRLGCGCGCREKQDGWRGGRVGNGDGSVGIVVMEVPVRNIQNAVKLNTCMSLLVYFISRIYIIFVNRWDLLLDIESCCVWTAK